MVAVFGRVGLIVAFAAVVFSPVCARVGFCLQERVAALLPSNAYHAANETEVYTDPGEMLLYIPS